MQRNIRVINDLSSKQIDYEETSYKDNRNTLLNSFKSNTNKTYTDNGAITNKSSLNPLLDFFMLAGSMRYNSENEIIDLFEKSLSYDELMTLKCMFYIGDIREGLGERDVFNILLKHTAKNHKKLLEKNIELIPFYSRWDYLYSLFDTPLENKTIEIIENQLKSDLKSDNPSLLAKWLYSPNTSNKEKSKLGVKTAFLLNLNNNVEDKICTINKYRKTLAYLRKKLNVAESYMSNKKFNEIDYEKLPSYAASKYSNSFLKNDYNRYMTYIKNLAENKASINTSTLYPHNIIRKILHNNGLNILEEVLIEKQWENLPNFINNKDTSALCAVDVSGSMSYQSEGLPMDVAVSLGLYLSERCSGPYKNKFLTFSSEPELVEIHGNNIIEKVKNIEKANWDMNTNIKSMFDIILEIAIENNLKQKDLPKYLYILSDMEFDSADKNVFTKSKRQTLFEKIKLEYEKKGYKLPILVFWNLNAKNSQSPMTIDDNGWMSVSGFSVNIFRSLMNEEFLEIIDVPEEVKKEKKQKPDAVELMLFTLNNKRYDLLKI